MRMRAPSPEHGVTFDLAAAARELTLDREYQARGQAARTLALTSDLRVVLVVLAAGKQISAHRANVTATVQTLTGRVRLRLPEHEAELEVGQLLVLGPGLPHDVCADVDSTFLLTLGWFERR